MISTLEDNNKEHNKMARTSFKNESRGNPKEVFENELKIKTRAEH
jgi:hypothetical protein